VLFIDADNNMTDKLEALAIKTLESYNRKLLSGSPSAVPIENIAGRLGIFIEYQCLCRKGHVLAIVVFNDDTLTIFNADKNHEEQIFVNSDTIIRNSRDFSRHICYNAKYQTNRR